MKLEIKEIDGVPVTGSSGRTRTDGGIFMIHKPIQLLSTKPLRQFLKIYWEIYIFTFRTVGMLGNGLQEHVLSVNRYWKCFILRKTPFPRKETNDHLT